MPQPGNGGAPMMYGGEQWSDLSASGPGSGGLGMQQGMQSGMQAGMTSQGLSMQPGLASSQAQAQQQQQHYSNYYHGGGGGSGNYY